VHEVASSEAKNKFKPTFDRTKVRQAAKALLEASQELSLGGIPIKELVNEGRP